MILSDYTSDLSLAFEDTDLKIVTCTVQYLIYLYKLRSFATLPTPVTYIPPPILSSATVHDHILDK